MATKIILTPEELASFLKKEKFGFILLGLCAMIPFMIWGVWIIGEMHREVILSEPSTVTIEKSAGFFEIVDTISENGIARSASLKLYLLATGRAGRIQSGTYVFSGSLSSVDVARQLVQGPNDISVIIPEGYTVFDIDRRLAQAGLIARGDFIEISKKPDLFSFEFLRSDEVTSLEGFLFPDTYRFSQSMDIKDIAGKMLSNFEKKVVPNMPERVRQDPGTLYLMLKIASLIEKEVPGKLDRALVSGILWKRIEIGMPLQVDASVAYALRLQDPNWQLQDHALSATDLKIKSLYNTYKYKDVPPTPISNPGLESILAALNPQSSQYLYYLSTKDGVTVFSKTFEEHNDAKEKYLK
ncbi:MAG: Aminodeoxychorismate lyase [Parcubacteria group bacterium GW2011_GWF1_45_5]|nr:MAG: Aminodeoxychorismate lyase [Parcubacteria group bacterium GW2011_GWF1_45_5]